MSVPSNDVELPPIQRRRVGANRLVGGAAAAVGGKLGYAVLSYASLVLAARLLRPENFGLYMLAVNWVATLTIVVSLGSQNTILALVPKYSESDPARARGVLAYITRSVWICSGVVTAALVLWADGIANLLGQPAAAPFLRIIGISLPFAAALGLAKVTLQATHAFVSAVFTSTLLQGILLQGALLAVAIAASVPPDVIAWCYTASFGVAAAIALWRTYREVDIGRAIFAGNAIAEPGLMGLSARFLAINVFLNLKSSVVVYVVARSLSADSIALFAAGQRTANLVSYILVGINFVFAPLIAAMWSRGDREEVRQMYTRATKWSIAVSLPACIALIAAAPGVLGLFGKEYVVAVPALICFALGQLVNASTGSVGYMLMMTGKERTMLINTVGVTVVSAIAAAMIAPTFGVTGAAAVVGATAAGFNLALLIQVRRELGVFPYNRETIRVLAAGAMAAAVGTALYPVLWHGTMPVALATALSIAVVVAVYVAAFATFALQPEDKAMIASVANRRRKKSNTE